MSDAARDLGERYARALAEFLAVSDESGLEQAYALGREAVAIGLGVIDLVGIHSRASEAEGLASSSQGEAGRRRLESFLSEALGPFEMALRGYREANETLRRSTATLEERVAQRSRELEEAQHDRRRNEERLRLMFEASPLPMWTYDRETMGFVSVNEAAIQHYGYSRDEFLGMSLAHIRPAEDLPLLRDSVAHPTASGVWRHRKKDGSLIWVEVTASDFRFEGRTLRLVLANDITERLRAEEALHKTEEQLRQSQKMDAIGRLAGGVAHDFNNLLTVVLSYCDLISAELPPHTPAWDDVDEIRKAGRRAADLTRQLLMFSRQQVLSPRVLDLNEILASMSKMLQRLIGADVDLVFVPASDLGGVKADAGSVEQVILNLVVNARDAMPTGGQITVETANVVLDERYAQEHLGAKAGPHVMLSVSDTGIGMDPATQARIFEPFFTTKEKGKGTGLGLSTVFGIVQQSGGTIWVYSEVGQGTTFKVYLPHVGADRDQPAPAADLARVLGGTETILLVDDDDQVRAVTRAILQRQGYQVIDARSADEALNHSHTHTGEIHLLLTDVVMPQMSGPELARQLAARRAGIRVLCMSGYTDDSVVRHGVLDSSVPFIQKPVTPQSLAERVRAILDGEGDEGGVEGEVEPVE